MLVFSVLIPYSVLMETLYRHNQRCCWQNAIRKQHRRIPCRL